MRRRDLMMRQRRRKQNGSRSEFSVVNLGFIFIAGIVAGIQISTNYKAWLRMDQEMGVSYMANHLVRSLRNEVPIRDMLLSPNTEIRRYPKTNKTIAACMLAMDDSIRLTEWIAYHYTILPLGSLMIAIDPNSQSQERVLKILDLWRDRINIIAYTNDSEWFPWKDDEGWGRRIYRENGELAGWLKTRSGPVYRSQSHKRRQNAFVLQCMKRFKAQLNEREPWRENSTAIIPEWVLMTDSDEFLVYNYIHVDQEDETNYELVRGSSTQDVDALRRKMIPKRKRLPALERHVTVADWLSVENGIRRCWKLTGLPMSSYDSDEGLMDHDVPKGINASHLMTLRFRKVGLRRGNFSKTLLDVSWGAMDQYTKDDVQNIHNPQKRICGLNGHSGSNADYLASVFRINHYSSGSLESHVERANDRRSSNQNITFSRFQTRNVFPVHEDDDVRPWIKWFVDKVGIDEAIRLLADPMKDAYAVFGRHPFVKAHKNRLILPKWTMTLNASA
ncbi:hypothetical protein MHU86_13274 [Fragilaria crotonensis]|nr:hypothetical protein MHU86_13274 [Fragilaria crotonensis]